MRIILLSITLLAIFANTYAQYSGNGLIVDDQIADKIPQKTRLLTRSYTTLPSSWSLQQYCPAIEYQGSYSTCAGWATGYAARTIAEAVRQGWKGSQYITSEAFSPLYVYGNIKERETKNCNIGTTLESAMKLLKNTGIVKKRSFDAVCVEYVKSGLGDEAAKYKIDDYFLLFGPDHTYEQAVNFPYNSQTSAALTYSKNDIALPGENTWLELDDTTGTDYLCVLFSKYAIDINSLLSYLQNSDANFYDKVKSGLAKFLAPQNEINFNATTMSFNATTTGAMVPLLVEFSYR